MNFFTVEESLGPKFIIFHYLIRWYLDHFGIFSYLVSVVGSIVMLLSYAISINIKRGEKDRVLMIVLLGIVACGGLIGLAFDIVNN